MAPRVYKGRRSTPRQPKGANTSTDYLVILDCSGSMMDIAKETIANFNEYVQTIKKASAGQDAKISLVLFSSPDALRTPLWRSPVDELKPMTMSDYTPMGTTALWDAIVRSVGRLSVELGEPIKLPKKKRSTQKVPPAVLVTIITDGWENSSITVKEAVVRLIATMKETGRWTFAYVGSNQDLENAADLGIPRGNIMQYESNSAGTRVSGQAMNSAVATYAKGRALGVSSVDRLYSTGGKIASASEIREWNKLSTVSGARKSTIRH